VKVLLVDNYDSFVYNIAQYLGELGAHPLIYRSDKITVKQAKKIRPQRIVLSPGPGTPCDERYFGNNLSLIRELGPRIPTLGICLGHQGIVYAFEGGIAHATKLMHGKLSLVRHDGKGVFKGVSNPCEVTRYHSLVADLFHIPPGLRVTAYSLDDCEVMGVRHIEHPIEGIQFHPESVMTREGKKILKNFLDGGED